MAKKQVRNKFRDIIGDYYLTNREITKHYDQEHKENKKEKPSWKKSEKTMIIITVAAVALLAIKYLIL